MCALFRRSKAEEDEAPDDDGLDGADDGLHAEPDVDGDDGVEADLEDADDALDGADEGDEASTAPADEEVGRQIKDLAARMSMLTSNVDGVKEDRGVLEDKLKTLEERMLRLGALAEAVSSKYNPFIQENAPTEPSWEPDLADGDAVHTPASPEVGQEPGPAEAPVAPPGSGQPMEDEPEVPEPSQAMRDIQHRGEGPDAPSERPRADPVRSALGPLHEQAPKMIEYDIARGPSTKDPFAHNLLLLEWVGMLLRRVGRAGLLDLLDYYDGLGWLDDDLKSRVMRVAVGVDAPDRVDDGSWRGDLDLHARSLVALERLQGRQVSAARLEELRMDMDRLFGG